MTKPFSKMMWRLALMSSLVVSFLAFTGVHAHELRPAIADVTMTKTKVKIELLLTVETLLAGIDLTEVINTDDAPQAIIYDQLRSLTDTELANLVSKEWPSLAQGLLIEGGGSFKLNNIEVIPETNLDLPRDTKLTIQVDLPMNDDPVAFGWVARNGGLVVRHGTGDNAYAAFLNGGELSAPLPRTGFVDETKVQVFWRFMVEGIKHIIPKGLDHILFVFGLFLFSLAWRPLLSQITAFTLAHTVTLGLSILNFITIPALQMWLVEALIAISISYVAIENILRPKLGWWRIVVVFGFGLLHGLGFASVLGDLGLAQGQFILSLVAFNIGVEFGQLTVIAVAFMLLALPFGRFIQYRKVVVFPCSLTIATIGIYWFFERAFS